jgi:hypothetical protein
MASTAVAPAEGYLPHFNLTLPEQCILLLLAMLNTARPEVGKHDIIPAQEKYKLNKIEDMEKDYSDPQHFEEELPSEDKQGKVEHKPEDMNSCLSVIYRRLLIRIFDSIMLRSLPSSQASPSNIQFYMDHRQYAAIVKQQEPQKPILTDLSQTALLAEKILNYVQKFTNKTHLRRRFSRNAHWIALNRRNYSLSLSSTLRLIKRKGELKNTIHRFMKKRGLRSHLLYIAAALSTIKFESTPVVNSEHMLVPES